MKCLNEMNVKFLAISENEGFARVCVASFCSMLNPNLEEIGDIKTAVSEAVTNSIVHAYPNKIGNIEIDMKLFDNNEIYIAIIDNGIGIKDIKKAREPFFTTKPSKDRSGMGFTVMEGFMDSLEIKSNVNKGVQIVLKKQLCSAEMAIGG